MKTVFVYGTLRAGGVRAIPKLFPRALFIGLGTVPGRLYDFGAYPGFIAGPGSPVIGEVYNVDPAALSTMDDIERIADQMYVRTRHIITMATGSQLECWAYEVNPDNYQLHDRDLIISGDWIVYAGAKGELPPEHWPDEAPIKFGASG